MASGGGDSCEESCEDVNLKELNESIDELSIYGDHGNLPKTSTPMRARRRLSGHTSMEVLKLLTVNLDALGAIRNAFGAREAFNVHPTTHHSEEDPFPDQLKGMWFCLQQKFFDPPENRDYIPKLSNKGEVCGKVSITLVDVYKKGKSKVSENFGHKLFHTFHILPDCENTVNHELNEEVEED